MTRKDGKPRSLPTTLGLDPLPWSVGSPIDCTELRMAAEPTFPAEWVDFDPRPGYSQNPADYGVHDDRWKEQS